jgi:hypothetical protein
MALSLFGTFDVPILPGMRMVRPSLYRIDQRRDGLPARERRENRDKKANYIDLKGNQDARRCRRFATEQKAQRLQGYRRNGKSGQYYTDSTPASVLVLRVCYVDFNPRILNVSVQLGMHWSGPRSAMLNANGTLRARLLCAGRG